MDNIRVLDAKITFKNFSGKPSMYNRDGDRNFGLILDEELANDLLKDGWNVKRLKPREDDPDQYETPWLPVKVKFGKIPPICVLITSAGKRRLTKETIDQLDWTKYKKIDLVVRPYEYPARDGRPGGIAAYLKALYFTVQEDELAYLYADIPDLDYVSPQLYDEAEEETPF